MSEKGTYIPPKDGWTCFHCGETFTTTGAASDHFGGLSEDLSACRIKHGEEMGLLMELRKSQERVQLWMKRAPSEEAKKLARDVRNTGRTLDGAASPIYRCLEDARRQAYERAEKHAKATMTAAKSESNYHEGWNAAVDLLIGDLTRAIRNAGDGK